MRAGRRDYNDCVNPLVVDQVLIVGIPLRHAKLSGDGFCGGVWVRGGGAVFEWGLWRPGGRAEGDVPRAAGWCMASFCAAERLPQRERGSGGWGVGIGD